MAGLTFFCKIVSALTRCTIRTDKNAIRLFLILVLIISKFSSATFLTENMTRGIPDGLTPCPAKSFKKG